MACKRDIILKLKDYIESKGITLNIGKNKARGNKGFFKTNQFSYRIDISNNLTEDETVRVLLHELIHYIHYNNDNSLKSLDFIFKNQYEKYEKDLLKLTVDSVPKDFAQSIYNRQKGIKKEISILSDKIKKQFPGIKLSNSGNKIENDIKKSGLKYLLVYDRVKIFDGFKSKIYSIKSISNDFPDTKQVYIDYIKLASLKRELSRINGKISRLNRYYTNPSELLARSFEYFFLNAEYMRQTTPNLYSFYSTIINENPKGMIAEIQKVVLSSISQ